MTIGRLCVTALASLLFFSCPDTEGQIIEEGSKCQIVHGLTHTKDQFAIQNSLANKGALYYLTGKFGNNEQQLPLAVDTGSSNLIVQGANCAGCTGKSYNPAESGSAVAPPEGGPFPIDYGSGCVAFNEIQDLVSFSCSDPIKYTFGSIVANGCPARQYGARCGNSQQCTLNSPVPNIFGLAYFALNTPTSKKSPTFMDQAAAQYAIDNVFSMQLCGTRGGSQVVVGGSLVDEKEHQYTKIVLETYYVVQLLEITAVFPDGTTRSLGTLPKVSATNRSTQTILDSGTTLNNVPTPIYSAIVDIVSAAIPGIPKSWFNTLGGDNLLRTLSEADLARLPVLRFSFPDSDTTKPFFLNLKPQIYLKDFGGGKRAFGFRDSGRDVIILGQPFMEGFHLIFDRDDQSIGFAPSDELCG